MVEHTAYHNWLRAHEKVVALQPTPTPKPTITPKPALSPVKAAFALQTAVVKSSAATTATKTSASNAGSFDFLGHLNDQCRESENRVYARYGLPPRPRS